MSVAVVRQFADAIAAETGIPASMLLSRRRGPGVRNARERLWAKLHARGWSSRQIGLYVGRDGSTIRHAIGGQHASPAA